MSHLTLVIGNRNLSSWSMRAWLALRSTGAQFDEVLVPLDRPETGAEILRWSPTGRVPALHDGGLVIWDSLAICEYLGEKFPEAGLWPADPAARAAARSVTAEMHSGFTALRSQMPMNLRASRPLAERDPAVDEDIRRILEIWESCRRDFGSGGELLFGEFTIADAFFAPVASRFITYGVEPQGAARRYMEALWAQPAVREWADAARAEDLRAPRHE
jgi:glutathione S-transferase